jgi:iron complex transport system substrate-binding protein
VKENKVYIIPKVPFNWFDRPPSFMRIIGLKWLLSNLYPAAYKSDFNKDARDFYRLFLNIELSQEEMTRVIFREAGDHESHDTGFRTAK